MKGLFSLFKKEKKEEPEVEQQTSESYKEDIVNDYFLSCLNTKAKVSYPDSMQPKIHKLLKGLNNTLELHKNALCVASIEDAIDATSFNSQNFHTLLDEKDDAEKVQDLLDDLNRGDDSGLLDYLYDWFSEEEAENIAIDMKKHKATYENLQEMSLQVSKSVVSLGLGKKSFGNAYLAIREQLDREPSAILEYMELSGLSLLQIADMVVFHLHFKCSWESWHGINWIVKGKRPIYVGPADPSSLSSEILIEWNELHQTTRKI